MSSTMVIRYATRADAADENARLVADVFAELAQAAPEGLHYATFRLADGVSFLHVLVNERDDNPLMGIAAFAEFQKGIAERCAEPPVFTEATVVGSYGFGAI